jgi:Protein of unknown function (DUF1697)
MKEEAGGMPALHALGIHAQTTMSRDRSGMIRYIAVLRAVNVGGTGKLPMADLIALCEHSGFTRVQTYIASGNVLFESKAAASKVSRSWRHACSLTPEGRSASCCGRQRRCRLF